VQFFYISALEKLRQTVVRNASGWQGTEGRVSFISTLAGSVTWRDLRHFGQQLDHLRCLIFKIEAFLTSFFLTTLGQIALNSLLAHSRVGPPLCVPSLRGHTTRYTSAVCPSVHLSRVNHSLENGTHIQRSNFQFQGGYLAEQRRGQKVKIKVTWWQCKNRFWHISSRKCIESRQTEARMTPSPCCTCHPI